MPARRARVPSDASLDGGETARTPSRAALCLSLLAACASAPTAAAGDSITATAAGAGESSSSSRGGAGAGATIEGGAPAASPDVAPELRHGLPWYVDAPDAALAAARSAGKPLFVDLWAPWCHTCTSMQSFVLTAENFPSLSRRFVLLALDTERSANAPFLERYPVGVWPTFYIVDARSGELAGRWLGAASPAQLSRFLDAGEHRVASARQGAPADDAVTAAVLEGDALATRGDAPGAARAYARALELAPPDWPRRPETLVARITALWKSRATEPCLELAEGSLAGTGDAASSIDFSAYALECAAAAPDGDPRARRVREAVRARMTRLCAQGSDELTPDDRADGCAKASDAHEALGDAAGARRATTLRLEVLERAAAGKPDDVAIAYDWARTDSLLELGRAEEAVALNAARERAVPGNYNPPAYLARSYARLERWEAGLAAIERALALAYGPRRAGLMTLKIDLLLGAGRRDAAIAVAEEQLEAYRSLPSGQKQPAAEARAEARLRSLRAPAPPPAAPKP